jgi:hypothetical protein
LLASDNARVPTVGRNRFEGSGRRTSGKSKRGRSAKRRGRRAVELDDGSSTATEVRALDWKEELLETVMSIKPDAFRAAGPKRMLREAGFISATVTGRSGD